MTPWGLHWFRRDLRVAGNPALRWSAAKHDGRVLGLFCFDSKFLARPDFSHHRFAFFLKTLAALRDELRELGGDLLVLDATPGDAVPRLLKELGPARPTTFSFNRDYEPFARARDLAVREQVEALGIETHVERDHLLIEPEEIHKSSGEESSFYSVFTPFARRWFEALRSPEVQARLQAPLAGLPYLHARAQGKAWKKVFQLQWKSILPESHPFRDALDAFLKSTLDRATIKIPDGGSLPAFRALLEFSAKIDQYAEARDVPSVPGTSRLSMYLKNGSLTVPQIVSALELGRERLESRSGRTVYLKELAWREFYYHILWHVPRVEGEAFNPKYRDLRWENDERAFAAWKAGRTGYPIVDAAMRELSTTGWMHNRARMIVASFLTKDLLIDWRWGERYFMEQLLDGDLAPNNGGWQWAASTGCDPQPYFRIFNPALQSRRFDEDGEYIRRFVPELASLSAKEIHDPNAATRSRLSYPAPIVDHAESRAKALALYRSPR